MKKALQYLVPLGLAGFLLWYAYKDMDFHQMWADIKQAHYWAVLATFATTLIAHVARAARWNLMFNPIGYHPSLKSSFLAVMSGYFANLIFPRAGEVTRCTVLLTSEKIPLQTSIGTVLAERGLDLVLLLLITLTAFGLEYDVLTAFVSDMMAQKSTIETGAVDGPNYKLWFLGFLAVSGILTLVFWRIIREIPLVAKILNFAKGLLEGLLSILKIKQIGLFSFYTILIWTCYFFTTYFSLFMFDFTFDLGFHAAFMLLVIGSFGMVAPVQGGIGAFHWLVSTALMVLYSKPEGLSKTSAAMMHGTQTLFTLALGGVCFFFSVVLANQNKKTEIETAHG
jgi:uncharacterized membrane protein YbhN (UPF0104 family)